MNSIQDSLGIRLGWDDYKSYACKAGIPHQFPGRLLMDSSMHSMDGYVLTQGRKLKEANSVCLHIPQRLLLGFPWGSFELL